MKAGPKHRVPLTDEALALIDSDPAESKYLFPSPSGYALSNMAMLQLLRGLPDDGSTVHGIRSSLRDWAAEQTNQFGRLLCVTGLTMPSGQLAILTQRHRQRWKLVQLDGYR